MHLGFVIEIMAAAEERIPWECALCTFLNFVPSVECEMCGSPMFSNPPAVVLNPPGGRAAHDVGDHVDIVQAGENDRELKQSAEKGAFPEALLASELPPPPPPVLLNPPPLREMMGDLQLEDPDLQLARKLQEDADVKLAELLAKEYEEDADVERWECMVCAFMNYPGVGFCEMCNQIHIDGKTSYLKCPTDVCAHFVPLRGSGDERERCECPGCGYVFCSECNNCFHGLLGAPKAKSKKSSSFLAKRLSCEGAAIITSEWEEWKTRGASDYLRLREGRLQEGSEAESDVDIQKHHVNLAALPVKVSICMARQHTEEYRMKCTVCQCDIIGPRFSCIHCSNFECCLSCSSSPKAVSAQHSPHHAFQIFFEDQNPLAGPVINCSICLSDDPEDLDQLESCSHFVHKGCLEMYLAARWAGKRISFVYLTCPECRIPIDGDDVQYLLAPHLKFKKKVENVCIDKCREDDIVPNLDALIAADEPAARSMCFAALSCFICVGCQQPFSGGRVDCAEDASLDITALRCQRCAFALQRTTVTAADGSSSGADQDASSWRGKCFIHGFAHAIYKCDSCCAVAVFDCRTNHYCDRCHRQPNSAKNYPCPGKGSCPLGIAHPPNKPGVHGQVDEGFIIGCGQCFAGDAAVVSAVSDQWKARFEDL